MHSARYPSNQCLPLSSQSQSPIPTRSNTAGHSQRSSLRPDDRWRKRSICRFATSWIFPLRPGLLIAHRLVVGDICSAGTGIRIHHIGLVLVAINLVEQFRQVHVFFLLRLPAVCGRHQGAFSITCRARLRRSANSAGCTPWRVAYVFPDLMPPGDRCGRRRRGQRCNHSFQLGLHFRPPCRAFFGAGRLVDRALVDQHGLVERESHSVLFRGNDFPPVRNTHRHRAIYLSLVATRRPQNCRGSAAPFALEHWIGRISLRAIDRRDDRACPRRHPLGNLS